MTSSSIINLNNVWGENMSKLPILFTERLIIRPLSINDAQDMYDYSYRDNVGPRAGWKPHQSIADSEAVIRSMINQTMTDTNIGIFALEYRENKKMIGTIGVHRYDKTNLSAEVGYVLHPDYWGKGLMVEALTKVIMWLFDQMGLYRIECSHFDFNFQSKRVIEKCGFTFEGISRKKIVLSDGSRADLYNYAILRDEYLNKQLPWQKKKE